MQTQRLPNCSRQRLTSKNKENYLQTQLIANFLNARERDQSMHAMIYYLPARDDHLLSGFTSVSRVPGHRLTALLECPAPVLCRLSVTLG